MIIVKNYQVTVYDQCLMRGVIALIIVVNLFARQRKAAFFLIQVFEGDTIVMKLVTAAYYACSGVCLAYFIFILLFKNNERCFTAHQNVVQEEVLYFIA